MDLMLRLACAGSLPPMGDPTKYPFSHVDFWLQRQRELQYSIVGTGEPGGKNRYGMIERFTQDMEGIEVRARGDRAESHCVGRIKLKTKPEDSSEVAEIKYLASLVPPPVLRKATVTDPVSIGFGLIAHDPRLMRTYPEIYDDVTEALQPIVGAISDSVDIIQFDCPLHVTRAVREPWRYVNELAKATRKRIWIHIDGDVSRMLRELITEYRADALNVNFFGAEEGNNLNALAEWKVLLREGDKKLVPAVINTQIGDREEEIEPLRVIRSRVEGLSSLLGRDGLEAITPGCGLRLLPGTAQIILERLRGAVQTLG
jgi:methionine synthase II (cobalamin-independent)